MPARKITTKGKAVKHVRSTSDNIYDGMVAEATSGRDFDSLDERPLKRRKAGPSKSRTRVVIDDAAAVSVEALNKHATTSPEPTSEDDLAFEDIDLDRSPSADPDSDGEMQDVRVSLGQRTAEPTSTSSGRRTAPRTEKNMRILGHKAHFLALLSHCMLINDRCNDREVHKVLRARLDAKQRAFLRPNKEHTQFQQDRTFTLGLDAAVDAFKDYQVTTTGIHRAYWLNDGQEPFFDKAEPFSRSDFRRAAREMSGSQDTGNQLFCAMLRAVGVTTRIVCSLQVLPLANTTRAPITPSKPSRQVVLAIAPDVPLDQSQPSDMSIHDKIALRHRSRLSKPAFRVEDNVRTISQKRHVDTLTHPVFWVEVLNAAYQKWMPVDPIVTETIGKPSKLEPPLSYPLNQLAYAIPFSKDASAKDVTQRYARSFNAKTRRLRLESVGEAEWLRKMMLIYKRRKQTHADEIEDTELIARLNRERLPNNIQDFKGHPVYALERHLKRNEVIHPRRGSGTVNAGTAATPKMEAIFRRTDVHVCRSADQWFRHGRVVKSGEQAVKLVPSRARPESDDEDVPEETALYMLVQTELYIPESVVRGRVPRNNFGNLDVYVPSMVPKGGAHVPHPLGKTAAEILQIDAVDAVTGFKFTGRKGAVVITGVVVPEKHYHAVQTVIEGLIWQEANEKSQARSALAMRLWKKFLQGLKIAERVQSYATEPVEEQSTEQDRQNIEHDFTGSTAWYADDDEALHTAGQYHLNVLIEMAKQAKKVKPAMVRKRYIDSEDGDVSDGDGLENHTQDKQDGGFVDDQQDGGGFLVDEQGGGFVVDEQAADISGGFTLESAATSELEVNARDDAVEDGGGFMLDDQAGGDSIDLTVDTPPVVISTSDSEGQIRRHIFHQKKRQLERSALRPITGLGKVLASDDERESLVSHDPEDDDAEPDWMESD